MATREVTISMAIVSGNPPPKKDEVAELKRRITYYMEMYESKQSMLEMTVDHLDEVQEELRTAVEKAEKVNRRLQDGINYAERLQSALLPDEKKISEILERSFVIFRPKFTLSGDFYWFSEYENRKYVAAIDCTGHGIPGAMITMIIDSALSHLIKMKKLVSPSNILKQLDTWVDNRLHKSQEEGEPKVRDGADAALLVYNESKKRITFAGAHLPLYLLRDGEIQAIKGGRYSIGENSKRVNNIEDHVIEVKSQDRIFLFTDGIPDQFGGEDGKSKLGKKNLKRILLETSKFAIEIQKIEIEKRIKAWQNKYSQIDDMLLLGFQID